MVLDIGWMALALIAASCWGMVSVLDKAILESRIVKIKTRQFIDSCVGLIIAASMLWKISYPSISLIVIGIIGGFLVFAFNYLYYHALRQADVSAVSIYLQSIPVFSAILGYVFFADRFQAIVYVGALLVIAGAVLVAIERSATGKFTIFIGKNMSILIKNVLPAALILSISYGLIKLLLVQYTFWEVYFWGRIGFSCTGFVLYIFARQARIDIKENIKLMKFKTIYGVALIESLNFLGILLLTAAYAIGTLTLVSTVAAIQPLIVIIVLLSIAILKGNEPLKDFSSSKRILILRIVAVFIQVVGMFLLYHGQIHSGYGS